MSDLLSQTYYGSLLNVLLGNSTVAAYEIKHTDSSSSDAETHQTSNDQDSLDEINHDDSKTERTDKTGDAGSVIVKLETSGHSKHELHVDTYVGDPEADGYGDYYDDTSSRNYTTSATTTIDPGYAPTPTAYTRTEHSEWDVTDTKFNADGSLTSSKGGVDDWGEDFVDATHTTGTHYWTAHNTDNPPPDDSTSGSEAIDGVPPTLGKSLVDGKNLNALSEIKHLLGDAYNTIERWWQQGKIQDAFFGFVDGLASSLNPFQSSFPIPPIGAYYGNQGAYMGGNIAGMVVGIAGQMLIGNIAAGGLVGCGSFLQKAALVYTRVSEIEGMAGAIEHIATTGTVGFGDVLAFLPLLTYGMSAKNCFVAGTQVVTGGGNGSPEVTRNIEEVRKGDLVLTRSQSDPTAPLELKPVTQVFSHTVTELEDVTIEMADGKVETLQSTTSHPYYVQGLGWTAASNLVAGERVLEPDGSTAVIRTTSVEYRPEGVTVYNFEVKGDHTYFVGGNGNDASHVWVHNECRISPPHPDYYEKGLHVHTGGFEVSLRPNGNGITPKIWPLHQANLPGAAAAIREVETALQNKNFLQKLYDTAVRSQKAFKGSGLAIEMKFLALEFKRMIHG